MIVGAIGSLEPEKPLFDANKPQLGSDFPSRSFVSIRGFPLLPGRAGTGR
jgi:hypothetical protein